MLSLKGDSNPSNDNTNVLVITHNKQSGLQKDENKNKVIKAWTFCP
jgi:hypothetical protein